MRWIMRWLGRGERDLEEEIRAHIEMETRENIDRGMQPREAARAAERTFGNAVAVRDVLRQGRPTWWLDVLLQDLRFGVRLLWRSPFLAVVIVVTLTFGIALCSTVFTLLNAELLRAKVDRDPASFLSVLPAYRTGGSYQSEPGLVPLSDYAAYRSGVAELADLAAWDRIPTMLDEDSSPFNSLLVTCNFFAVYGISQAKLGRLLLPEECAQPGGAPVAVLSEEIWSNRFGADPRIIGTVIRFNRLPVTVVGIAPAGFSGRNYRETHAWLPYTAQPVLGPNSRRRAAPPDYFRAAATPWLQVAGRLRPGARRSEVQSALQVIARQQDRLALGRTTTLFVSDGSQLGDPFRRSQMFWPVVLVLGVATLVLMGVCTNVTLLLLSRAAARRREIAVRLSLGASRFRLLRMLMTESLILAAVAGMFSAWLSWRLPAALRNVIGEPANYSVRPDWISFAYLLAITLLAGCFAGLAPALESMKTNLTDSLKEGGLSGPGAALGGARRFLVCAQVAISLLLLILACMIVRANSVYRTDPGFAANRVMAAALAAKNQIAAGASDFQRSVTGRLSGIPGVKVVAYADEVRQTDTELVRLAGTPAAAGRETTARTVSKDFFQAMGIPIVQGRPFHESDLVVSTPVVAIVSQSLARAFGPGGLVSGRQIEGSDGKRMTIIGIAADLPRSYFNGTPTQLYRLLGQRAQAGELIVRFGGDSRPLATAIRSAVRDVDPTAAVIPQTLESRLANSDQTFRILARLVLGLGAVTILLAVVGIYGVVAFAVKQRTRELGIRVALGASGGRIVTLVLVSGLKPVGVGMMTGLLLALAASRVVERAFGNTGVPLDVTDPLTFLAGTLVLSAAAIAAMYGPARRAGRADPMQAIRHE